MSSIGSNAVAPFPPNLAITKKYGSQVFLWLPNQITGLQVWFDGADTATLNRTGTTVNSWTGKGSSSITATSVGAGAIKYQQFNGKNALYFNGSNTKMTTGTIASYGASATTWISASTNLTPFTASTPVDASLVIATSGAPEKSIRYTGENTAQIYTKNNGTLRYSENTANGIRGYIDTAASLTVYVNGTNQTVTGNVAVTYEAGSNQSFILGQWASGTLNGYIQEILIYDSALTLPQYQQAEGYLAWKWGYQSSLPSTHPYYLNPPYVATTPFPYTVQVPRVASMKVFLPPNLASATIALWLDAKDKSTITTSGSTVTAWTDKSGTARTITFSGTNTYNASTESINTTNSPTSYFYANVNLKKSQVTYATVFIVHTWTGSSSTGTNQALWGQDIGGGYNRFQLLQFNAIPSYEYGLSYTPSSPFVTAVSALNTANRVLYSATYAYQISNGTFAYVNGSFASASSVTEAVSPSETSTTNTYFATIDTGYSGQVAFHEIIIYTSEITTFQRQQVEGYLAWKWGLVSRLPANHPYKLFPPPPN